MSQLDYSGPGGQAFIGVASGFNRFAEATVDPILHPIRAIEGGLTLANALQGNPVALAEVGSAVQGAIDERIDRFNNGGLAGKFEVATEGALTIGTALWGARSALVSTTSKLPAFGGLSRAGEFGIRPYGELRAALRGTGLQAHHLIENRFAHLFGAQRSTGLAVAVTRAEHQPFTNAFRSAISYGSGTRAATREVVLRVASRIYADYPAILRALGH